MSSIELTSIILGVISIVLAGGTTLLLKNLFKGYRRPNGKKGGITSLHVAVAFAIVTTVALITQDWFLTGMTLVLAYLVSREKIERRQHHLYQVVIGTIIGMGVPYLVFYLWNKRQGDYSSNDYTPIEREEYSEMPERAHDDRHEADEMPELSLEEEAFLKELEELEE